MIENEHLKNSGYFNICFSMNSIEQSGHSKNNCLHLMCMGGEDNGTPLQYSCLENPMDGGAW